MKPAEWAARHRPGPLDVVVTGLPSDAHTWNLVFIQLLLEEEAAADGFELEDDSGVIVMEDGTTPLAKE